MAKAWTVNGLRPDAPFRDAAGRVILTRWREMLSYREATLSGDDVEALHAMRVSSRRLRAAMDAFAPAFPRKGFRRRLTVVKRITDTLGRARDLDVAVGHLEDLLPELAPDERPGVEGLIADHRAERRAENVRIEALFARVGARKQRRDFERWVRRHTGVSVKRLDPRPPGDA